jgi:16S rRNA (cytosine1402-N4)-methyltransferase
MTYHKSVLVREVVQALALKPGGTYVDATFGGGGHTRALLEADPTVTVIALDWDTVALEKNGAPLQELYPDRLKLMWGNFAQIDRLLKREGIEKVDGILADFGTSQYQLHERAGFSFHKDSPLDMRMSPSHRKITAAELLNKASEEKLTSIFRELGQEPKARLIARAIVVERQKSPFKTTLQLSKLVERLISRHGRTTHPATKIFQALRIFINQELDNIHAFLINGTKMLAPNGRLVCISFHSLEDRIVKQFFKKQQAEEPYMRLISDGPIEANAEEVAQNPSSRSAKLRVAERV